jgi:hypothetical protein
MQAIMLHAQKQAYPLKTIALAGVTEYFAECLLQRLFFCFEHYFPLGKS